MRRLLLSALSGKDLAVKALAVKALAMKALAINAIGAGLAFTLPAAPAAAQN